MGTPGWQQAVPQQALRQRPGCRRQVTGRKRPHLIPIYDIRIKQLFERPKADHSFWAALAAALRAVNGAFRDQLVCLRGKASIGEDLGVVRVFDVIAWMHQGPQHQVATS
ncbi:DUF6308 family protein [Streptomyces sp. NPDC007929]|uniref:DUF6308 family protein n=1 Tax=Streptomyces sp. NPDC007929 TaxID=3364795 RepID=UPI0036E75A77